MIRKLNTNVLITFLFLSIIFNSPGTTTSQECPYPCFPSPPTGPGNVPPAAPTPPSQTGSYNPPPAYYNPPPSGYLPKSPSPPYFGGVSPPAPDPMVPWFPFYYRKPPHGNPDQTSSSADLPGWTAVIVTTHLLVLQFYFLLFH